jgi:hypothetical protein
MWWTSGNAGAVNNEFPFSAGFVLSSGLAGLKNEIDRLRVREVKWKD